MPVQIPGKNHGLRNRLDSGQAILEYAVSAIVMATLLFGMIDFGRAIYQQQTITSMAAQGAKIAMIGTGLSDSASDVISGSNLNMGTNGCVIMSSVYATSPTALTVSDQQKNCSTGLSSKIGTKGGTATIPAGAVPVVYPQTVYIAEVYYKYTPITPIGQLLHFALPTQLYDAAYY